MTPGIRLLKRSLWCWGATACAVTLLTSVLRAAEPPVAMPHPMPPVMGMPETGMKDLTQELFPHGMDSHAGGHEKGGHGAHCETCGHEEEEHEGQGFYGTLEYQLMRARRGAGDFAIVDPSNDLVPGGRVESLNYSLRSGLKAGAGYRFKDSAWEVAFAYTFLRTSTTRAVEAPPGGLIYPTLTRPGLNDQVGFASVAANLEYNLFDIVAARRIKIDERLSARAFGGVRFAGIRQSLDATYDRGDAVLGMVRTRANFDGFGPLLGAEGSLQVYRGFHLYARGSASLLTGKISNPITETNSNGITQYAALDYSTRRVVPVVSMGIGGGWQYHNVALRIGYDVTNLFNLIDQPRFTNDFAEGKITTRSADLSLEGLFVQVALQY